MSAEHACACQNCDPHLLGPAEQEGEHHIAIRFGHYGPWRIVLDDVEVQNETYEALAGEHGWVLVYAKDAHGMFHACRTCYQLACASKRLGHVEISYRHTVPV